MGPVRSSDWERRLRPLRPGAEPIEGQLARRFLARVVLSGVTGAIFLFILAIFAGFGRPDIGLGIVAVAGLPVVAWSWVDYAILRRRVRAYVRQRDGATADAPPGRA